jgi:hypothetical protein
MRKLLSITILGAVVLLSLSAQAQRGMGGRSGGVSMGGRGAGPSMGARSVGGRGVVAPARVGGPAVSSARGVAVRTSSGRVIVNGRFPFNGRTPFGFGHCFGTFPCRNRFFFNPFLFNSGFFNNGFGFGLGYPYYSGFDSGYYAPPQQPAPVASDNGNSNDIVLAMQMQRMSDEIESMREENRQANAARASGSSLSAHQAAEATTFVFRDGHRVSTQNYAIAGQTLWLLSEHMAKKVALADLDLAATEQVNAANGIDLRIAEPRAR